MGKIKQKIQDHPFFWLISIIISIIAGTTAANWFIYEKIIYEKHKLKLQEKQNELQEKEARIAFLNQKVSLLSDYKRETKGKIQNIVNRTIEPYKTETMILRENLEKQKKQFFEKERELTKNLEQTKTKNKLLENNIAKLKKKNSELKRDLTNSRANEQILKVIQQLEDEENTLELDLEDKFSDLEFDIHDLEKCKKGKQPDQVIMTPRGEFTFNPCDSAKTLKEIEVERSKIEWLKSKIVYKRKRILDLQNKIKR